MKILSFILVVGVCVSARPDGIDPHGRRGSLGDLGGVPHVRGSAILQGASYDDPHAGVPHGVSYGSAPHAVDVSYGSSSGSDVLHGAGYGGAKRVSVTHGTGYEGPKRVSVTHGTGYEGPKRVSVTHGTGYEGPKRVTVTHSSGYDGPNRSGSYAPAITNSYQAPHQVSVHGDAGYGTSQYSSGGDYAKGPAKYEFGYGVSDDYHGTNFGHTESRDGYLTKGEYYVDLPDGRRQKVSYYVDEWGYHPTVTYEGAAQFPHDKTPHDIGYQ